MRFTECTRGGYLRHADRSDVYFATDELAARFIEEIDFDYQDLGATASLQCAAS